MKVLTTTGLTKLIQLIKSSFISVDNTVTTQTTTLGDGTITITQGGVTKGTFTTNQSGNSTIALDAGGGTPSNMVTIDTAQTITSVKTFDPNSNAYIKSDQIRSVNDDLIFYTGNSSLCNIGYYGRELRLDGSTTRPQYSTDGSTYNSLALYSDISPEIFKVTYNTTTYTEITTALAANKLPICEYNNRTYYYFRTINEHVFTSTFSTTNDYITVDSSNHWATVATTLANSTLSNVTSISSGSAVQTALNDKYDASNPNGYTSNVGTVTSVNNTSPDVNGNVTISIPSISGLADTNLSNLSATGQNVIDGQWVALNQDIIDTATSATGTSSLDYTVNVPNDGHKYELLVFGQVSTGTTSGNWVLLDIRTSITQVRTAYAIAQRASQIWNNDTFTIPLGTDRKISVVQGTNYVGDIRKVTVMAYRRIGTNS